jgi:serine/threonine-protein kinase
LALTLGTRLGVYEVTAQIGAGGMGEVYRATDSNLKRSVAIKVLPATVAGDADRLARFQREAEVLAALNHPNIAAIYGLEKTPDLTALVMELVEGDDLSQRIARGAIPLDEALPIAKQIAEALEAAHEQGIIHRDLKPANIKVRSDGTVKVLDFGLAKALDPTPSSSNVTNSPTLSLQATQAGLILGTAAYMSPEQARGRAVDKRTDVWAFGCVLFEMLGGARPFDGEDLAETIGAVIHNEPAWDNLPATTPGMVRTVLQRCLEKDPKQRVRDIGDVRLALKGAFDAPVQPGTAATHPASVPKRRIAGVAGAALVVGAAVAAIATWALTRPAPAKLQSVRFEIVPPASQPFQISAFDRDVAISPDGTHLVYVRAANNAGQRQLMIRPIDRLDAVPLHALNSSSVAISPFVSPDSRWVGFFEQGSLKKVSITGGPPLVLCRYAGTPRGASWGSDGTIVFATNDTGTGLLSVAEGGGEPKVLTTPDPVHGEQDHLWPSVLPGGRAALFTVATSGSMDEAQVVVLDLKTGQRKTLIRGGSQAEYVDPAPGSGQTGYLIYGAAGTLRAVRFDLARLEVLSDPVPVVEQVLSASTGSADFSISRQGTLVYAPGGSSNGAIRSLVWVNRQGQEEPIKAPPRVYQRARLSPDGTRVVLDIRDQELDLWILDLARQTLTKLTDSPAQDSNPVWTPDSRRLIFASRRAGGQNLFWQAADNTGTVERLTTAVNVQIPTSISPDGTRLVFRENLPETGGDLRTLRMDGTGPRQTEPLLHTKSTEDNGEISPDGHWLAYQSNESGQFQIYVRPFPNVDSGHWQISTNGGAKPAWAHSGRELFYEDALGAMTAVPVQTAPTFVPGNPTKLFDGRYLANLNARAYDVSRDGQRFLMIRRDNTTGGETSAPAGMVVVLNWFEELKQRVSK